MILENHVHKLSIVNYPSKVKRQVNLISKKKTFYEPNL